MTLNPVDETASASSAVTPDSALSPKLVAKLAEPGVTESLTSLLSHADLIAILVEGLDGLLSRSELIGNSLLEGFAELQTTAKENEALAGSDINLEELLGSVLQLAAIVPKAAPGLADAAATGAVDKLALLGHGLVKGDDRFASDPVKVGGPISLLRLLKDPDINRALSYFATVAKAVGQELAGK